MRSVRNVAPTRDEPPLARHRHPRSARVGERANALIIGPPRLGSRIVPAAVAP